MLSETRIRELLDYASVYGEFDETTPIGTASSHNTALSEGQHHAIIAYKKVLGLLDVDYIQPAVNDTQQACRFVDCPPGLFRWGGLLCFKSEYSSKAGQPDAYCVDSGEYFWGATNGDLEKRCNLLVVPVTSTASDGDART